MDYEPETVERTGLPVAVMAGGAALTVVLLVVFALLN